MKILAIETSGLVSSVALAEDDNIIAEFSTNFKMTHSVTLLPMIENMLNILKIPIKEIEMIAASKGPGSFTGLRIGSSTAKGIAMALDIPIASVPTLEAMAMNIDKTDYLICPMIDARRAQAYTNLYEYIDNRIVELYKDDVLEVNEIIERIKKHSKKVVFLGDGFQVNRKMVEELMGNTDWTCANSQNSMQRASSVALLGFQYFKDNRLDNHLEHEPIYLRKSQAEREYEEKKTDN